MSSSIFYNKVKNLNLLITYKWTLLFIFMLTLLAIMIGGINIVSAATNVALIYMCFLLVVKIKYVNFFIILLFSLILSSEISFFILYNERVSILVLIASFDELLYAKSAPITFLIILILIFFVIFSMFYFSYKEIKKISLKTNIYLLVILFILLFCSIFNFIYASYKNTINDRLKADFFVSPLLSINYYFYKAYPLIIGDNFYLIAHYYETLKIKKNSYHSNVLPGVEIKKEKNDIPLKFILVLGETSLSTHYSLYGYSFKTTPKLDNLYRENQLIKIDNVISPAPITRESLRLSLSFDTPFNNKNFYNYKNIIELANMVGYKTYWLSTAVEFGINGTFVGMIQKSANITKDPTNDDILKTELDIHLLSKLEEFYKDKEKQFFVIHILGSHLPYGFNTNNEFSDFETTKQNSLYDRTILHTDKFIAGLIDLIKKHNENTILYYYSDHGEIINIGHGMVNGGGAAQYKVPLLVFQNKNTLPIKSIVEKYRSDNGILNNFNSHFIVSELIGFSIKKELIEQGKQKGKFIYHSDANIYLYEDFLQKQQALQHK